MPHLRYVFEERPGVSFARTRGFVEARGDFGTFRVRLDNRPSPANPKTSMLAPLSALAMVRRFSESLWVGA